MLSSLSKSSNLAPYLKATTYVISSSPKETIVTVFDKCGVVLPSVELQTTSRLTRTCLTGPSSGIAVPHQVRYAHTVSKQPAKPVTEKRDAKKEDSKKELQKLPPKKESSKVFDTSVFTYLMIAGGSMMGAYAAKGTVNSFISSLPASETLAATKIQIKLQEIPEGRNMTFHWRGKPLFVRHRTPAEIEKESTVDLSILRDPQPDSERTTRPEWLVVMGVCTHLGGLPISNAGDYGGYYCPCHGSHFDASGRIRKGPAPLNLDVPAHEFLEGDLLVVG